MILKFSIRYVSMYAYTGQRSSKPLFWWLLNQQFIFITEHSFSSTRKYGKNLNQTTCNRLLDFAHKFSVLLREKNEFRFDWDKINSHRKMHLSVGSPKLNFNKLIFLQITKGLKKPNIDTLNYCHLKLTNLSLFEQNEWKMK